MKDFQEKPQLKLNYQAFLIRTPQNLTTNIIDQLYHLGAENHPIYSLEQLFKGASQQALVIFGPAETIKKLTNLNLLEIEEYTEKIEVANLTALEFSYSSKTHPIPQNLMQQLKQGLSLSSQEQLFWQVVFQPHTHHQNTPIFQTAIRAVIVSADLSRRDELFKKLDESIKTSYPSLKRQIRPLTSAQIFNFYKTRSIYPKEISEMLLGSNELKGILS